VVAVELAEGPGLGPAIQAGKPVPVPRPADTLCDGMTPPFVGKLPLEVARQAVDAVVGVSEGQVVDALRLLFVRAKLYVEGSGAAATAAVLGGKTGALPGTTVVAIVSGGNVDPERVLPLFAPGEARATREGQRVRA
jgi:threonine dehydratase